jgi:hypothetical protein
MTLGQKEGYEYRKTSIRHDEMNKTAIWKHNTHE